MGVSISRMISTIIESSCVIKNLMHEDLSSWSTRALLLTGTWQVKHFNPRF